MKTVYPDYVKAFRPKGTVVRLRNGRYLVFSAKSKRVPGKSYPVLIVGELCGFIDSGGFHPQTKVVVDFSLCSTYEYGFSNLLLLRRDEFLSVKRQEGFSLRDADVMLRSLIVSISGCSYLSLGKDILSEDELASRYRINVLKAKASLLRKTGLREEETRMLFTVVGIYDGSTFRRLPMSEKVREMLSCFGIDERRIAYGDPAL